MLLTATLVICCVSCTNPIFVESRDITQGGVDGFAIGMSKQQILEDARQKHVSTISPVLNVSSSINYSNLESVVSPGDGRSVELDDGSAVKVVYTVKQCKVADIQSLGAQKAPSQISIGDTPEELVSNLKKILNGNHAASVHEVISSENGSWFVIDSPPHQHKNRNSIEAYDIWSFEVNSIKPAGAQFMVYFSEGSVIRISYKRPRIRVE